MITTANETGISLMVAMGKHAELIMEAYAAPEGGVRENEQNANALMYLCRYRLMQRDEDDGFVRLRTPIRTLLDQGLSRTRLKMVSTNIGEAIDSIEHLASEYRKNKSASYRGDADSLLQSLRENVYELCEQLLEQSREIWHQIDSDFGSVTQLSSKIALNKNALSRVDSMMKALGFIDFDNLYDIAKGDKELHRLLYSKLRKTTERCRRELGDAISRLNNSMFTLTRLAARARKVSDYVAHLRSYPNFQPANYVDRAQIPDVFLLTPPLELTGLADISSDYVEVDLARLLVGIRKVTIPDESTVNADLLPVLMSEQVSESLKQDVFQEAVREVFCLSLESGGMISGIERYDPEVAGNDPQLWLYAILSEYNAMGRDARSLIHLEFVGEYHPVFNGNFITCDIVLCRRFLKAS